VPQSLFSLPNGTGGLDLEISLLWIFVCNDAVIGVLLSQGPQNLLSQKLLRAKIFAMIRAMDDNHPTFLTKDLRPFRVHDRFEVIRRVRYCGRRDILDWRPLSSSSEYMDTRQSFSRIESGLLR
jgi:hypothetical protein